MLKKIALGVIILLFLVGCTPAPSISVPPVDTGKLSIATVPVGGEPPADMTWIYPGKVNVDGLYPGAQGEYTMKVHNGNATPTSFTISSRAPDYTADGYKAFPSGYFAWVTISDSSPVLQGRETRDILVTVKMPEGIKAPKERMEVWISVIDASQTGTVRTELCARWLITTR